MLGPLPFVAGRQPHDEPAYAGPLPFPRRDELVDHDLGAVREVAELRFPDDELVGARGRVTVFETDHGLLGEQRIDDEEVTLLLAHVLQRDIRSLVPALAVLVVQYRVAVE